MKERAKELRTRRNAWGASLVFCVFYCLFAASAHAWFLLAVGVVNALLALAFYDEAAELLTIAERGL